jgi:hypothetical protein
VYGWRKRGGLGLVPSSSSVSSLLDQAAARYGISAALLRAVAQVESGFNPSAVSGAGAQGVMQLMPPTAAQYGVVDSFDASQNIDAGAHLLSDLLAKYNGNTTLALAAYNAGPGAVAKYGGVPPYAETQAYVGKVLAAVGGGQAPAAGDSSGGIDLVSPGDSTGADFSTFTDGGFLDQSGPGGLSMAATLTLAGVGALLFLAAVS